RSIGLSVAVVLLLAPLAFSARSQLKYWRTSIDLLEHAIAVGGGSAVIYNNLGVARGSQGDWVDAEKQFRAALALQPTFDRARGNLAGALARQGRTAEAISEIHDMSMLWELDAHRTLGQILLDQSKLPEATA